VIAKESLSFSGGVWVSGKRINREKEKQSAEKGQKNKQVLFSWYVYHFNIIIIYYIVYQPSSEILFLFYFSFAHSSFFFCCPFYFSMKTQILHRLIKGKNNHGNKCLLSL
jgi:hypothetical protein